MKYTIIPSIIAKNQKQMEARISRVKGLSKILQLDVMDGMFVPNTSLDFRMKLPTHDYEAHLMIENPEVWTIGSDKKISRIIAHIEILDNPRKMIKIARQEGRKIFFALNPEMTVNSVRKYLDEIDGVLVLAVYPGQYGAKFLPEMLHKVRKLRKLKPKMDIEVDGGMNPVTIKKAKEAGANRFVVGSYLQKAKEVRKAMNELKKAIR